MNKSAILMVMLVLFFVTPVSAISFSITPAETSFSLGWDETAESSVEITSENSWYAMNCDVIKDGDVVDEVNDIGSGQTKLGSYLLTVPDSGSGTKLVDMSVYCKDDYGAEKTKSYSVDISYPLEGQSEAYSLIEGAEEQIDLAESRISEANNKVGEAERIGADVSAQEESIGSARSNFEGASTYLSRANDAYENKNFFSAQNDARTARNNAESALSDANDALREANSAIQQRRDSADKKIGSADNSVENLRTSVRKLENKLEEAKSNAIVVEEEEQILQSSNSALKQSEMLVRNARISFNNENYGAALDKADNALDKADTALEDVQSALDSLGSSIPNPGDSSVPTATRMAVKDLLSDDDEVSQEKAELEANNFEKKDLSVTKKTGSSYSAEIIYSHPSGETVTLSSTVDTAEGTVSDVSISGAASKINQKWKETQSAQQTRNSILMFAGVAILLIISGAFAYYFVNPVNKTVNNFVGEDGESGSGSTFNCSNCDAPVSPDDLEDGECPYCGATVSV